MACLQLYLFVINSNFQNDEKLLAYFCVVIALYECLCDIAYSMFAFLRSLLLQVAQLSQKDKAAGWVSDARKWKTVHGTNILLTL